MHQKPPRPPPPSSRTPPPSYNQAVHAESSSSYTPAPTDEHEHVPVFRGPDIAYLKSPAGIARIVEAVGETAIL